MSAAILRAHIRAYCCCAREEKDVGLCCESSGGLYPNDDSNRWKGVSQSQTTQRPGSVDQSAPKITLHLYL